VLDELVEFLEGPLVKEQLQSLARREFSLGVLARAAFFTSASFRLGVAASELLEFFL